MGIDYPIYFLTSEFQVEILKQGGKKGGKMTPEIHQKCGSSHHVIDRKPGPGSWWCNCKNKFQL